MARYIITRTFEVERTFAVEALSEEHALAHPERWDELDEFTKGVLDTTITEEDDDEDEGEVHES